MFKVILGCTDLSLVSKPALRHAVELAREHGARLYLLHVVALPPQLQHWEGEVFASDLDLYRKLLDRQIAGAKKELERQLAGHAFPVAPKIVVRAGVAPDLIASIANEFGADLIVVARGRSGQLGATSERVVRLAGRAVLVAPVRASRTLSAAGELARLSPPQTRRRARASA